MLKGNFFYVLFLEISVSFFKIQYKSILLPRQRVFKKFTNKIKITFKNSVEIEEEENNNKTMNKLGANKETERKKIENQSMSVCVVKRNYKVLLMNSMKSFRI